MIISLAIKGFDNEDISKLRHPDFALEYIASYWGRDIFEVNSISFTNISKVIVMGHSIRSDETYLTKKVGRCR